MSTQCDNHPPFMGSIPDHPGSSYDVTHQDPAVALAGNLASGAAVLQGVDWTNKSSRFAGPPRTFAIESQGPCANGRLKRDDAPGP